jgi:predicted peptidase
MSDFERRQFKSTDGVRLPYRLLRPSRVSEGEEFPLVLFLHGKGESGSDNEAQLKWCVQDFAKPNVRSRHPCFVAVPQCPEGDAWTGAWVGDKIDLAVETKVTDALVALLDELERELPIDVDRVYVGGLSMGGYGTWKLLAREPRRFSAAFPICGGGDPKTAASFKRIPIWAFHGAEDDVVPLAESQRMIDALRSVGAERVKFTVYPGVGHHSWVDAFNEPRLFDWLFAQRRS